MAFRTALSSTMIAEIRRLQADGLSQRSAKTALDQKHGRGPALSTISKYYALASVAPTLPTVSEGEEPDEDIEPETLPDGLPDDGIDHVVYQGGEARSVSSDSGLRAEVELLRQELRDSRKDSLAKLQNRSELSGAADLSRDQISVIAARLELAAIEKRLQPAEPNPIAQLVQLDELNARRSEPLAAALSEKEHEIAVLKGNLYQSQAMLAQSQSSVEIEKLRSETNLKILAMEKSQTSEKLELSKFWLEAGPDVVGKMAAQLGVRPGELRDSIRLMASLLNMKVGGHFTENGKGVSIPPPHQRPSAGVPSPSRPPGGHPPQEILNLDEIAEDFADLDEDDAERIQVTGKGSSVREVEVVTPTPSAPSDRRVIIVGGGSG